MRFPIFGIISLLLAGLAQHLFKETAWAIVVERALEELPSLSRDMQRRSYVAGLAFSSPQSWRPPQLAASFKRHRAGLSSLVRWKKRPQRGEALRPFKVGRPGGGPDMVPRKAAECGQIRIVM
jgi:hypothetical protein